ncbi:hypothetical protein [Mesobacillus maritimus]|uniref:Ferric oxidoreductase domain-containing protein n=1 Tax=Mesobacillus maritimus TaxID=1643336 RepID=A0ABS7K090_9BACI|nr:hypothetical protein [Mesobacillus maritimus]MBY0095636.1 hypothetical protein [Mesobacillus maritimus]
MITKWLTVNFLTIFIIVLWSNLQGYDSNSILLSKIFAQVAFILLLINLNMYFVFLIIRKSNRRDIKIRLAKISIRMMKYHVAIAVTATLLVLLHSGIMVYAYYENLMKGKTISGIILIAILSILLLSGFLRRRKATGKRRKFHYKMAFLFFGFLFLHIFL